MYSNVDYSITPRPIYPADGRKIPGLYSSPDSLHQQIETKLGAFPMFNFWGPKSDIQSSSWIADSARYVGKHFNPNLLLVYLPHLDYNLQRLGPNDKDIHQDISQIDHVAGKLIEDLQEQNYQILVVSEYGIQQAHGVVHINRVLRKHGLISTRKTLDWELLDYGASRAFAVADHQIAHIYIKDPNNINNIKKILEQTDGIEKILDYDAKKQWQLDHDRSGELIAIAEPGYWFSYYYWDDDQLAPDFARTVDIHRKPGYDPVELFFDPDIHFKTIKVISKLIKKKLGFRTLFDVIPLKPELVKGTHGRQSDNKETGPLVIGSNKNLAKDQFHITDIYSLILSNFR